MRLSDSSLLVVLVELMTNALINLRSMVTKLRSNSLIIIRGLKLWEISKDMTAHIGTVQHFS